MKKLVIFILVLSLVLGLATVVMAEEYEDSSSVTINKSLTLTNEGTLNPSETFSFTIGAGSGERDGQSIAAPAFNPAAFNITINAGETAGSADISLPDFTQVGVYTYPLTENEGNTAGMRYDSGEYYLVVTVINNPAFGEEGEPEFLRVLTFTDENNLKTEGFKNEFEAGSLTVNKVITGNYVDPDDEFEVTVTLTPNQGKSLNAQSIDAPGSDSFTQDHETGAVTIVYTVKGGNSFTINNIPYDVSYDVEETELPDGYDEPEYDGKSGQILEPAQETTITNNRDTEIATGINLDSMPYYGILTVAIGGLAFFIVRRRIARI